jgi:DNA-binding transcriptional MerR regulator
MNDDLKNKLYTIGEAAELVGLPSYVLRQWEEQFSTELKPQRMPSGHRRYTREDIILLRRIKSLIKHEGLKIKGARLRLQQEKYETGRPRNVHEIAHTLDAIAEEARAIIRLFDPDDLSSAEQDTL